MTRIQCAALEASGVISSYIAGTSSVAETAAFERHLVGCADCQSAVRLGVAIRRSVVAEPAQRFSRPMMTRMAMLAAAAVVVVVAGTMLARGQRIRALGALASPPAYGGIPVRADLGRADSLFGDGMRLYGEGRYADAAQQLRAARTAGADSTPTSFFIGAAALVDGDATAAIHDLAIVIRRGASPYAAEAHYYEAKAWLLKGRADSARAHLVAASESGAPIAAEARSLATRLAEVAR